jgi:hypothetical protein
MILNYQEISRLWYRFLIGKRSDFTIKRLAEGGIKETQLLQGNDVESVHIVKRLYRYSAPDQAVTVKVKLFTSDIII